MSIRYKPQKPIVAECDALQPLSGPTSLGCALSLSSTRGYGSWLDLPAAPQNQPGYSGARGRHGPRGLPAGLL